MHKILNGQHFSTLGKKHLKIQVADQFQEVKKSESEGREIMKGQVTKIMQHKSATQQELMSKCPR